ncbi:MAG: glycogen/starch synthase [Patescibacteria group bacterium]|jgi:starch synthase|nr:glycogen/starch synthase [Patescibacteria group bacterium]
MVKALKIVHVASEVAPFSKTGGLGDVARSLPKSLKRLGHDVCIITPLYTKAINKTDYNLQCLYRNVEVRLNAREKVVVNYWRGYLMEDLPVYFIENKKYFSKHKRLYGSSHENARFLVFNVAALKLLSLLKFQADIIHCHDWQAGLIPYYLKHDFKHSKTLSKARTIFTIHNLVFQLGHNWWEVPFENKDYGRRPLPDLQDPDLEHINFSKRAILSADVINTVSEQYRAEIMTKKFGQDLHRILRNRSDRLFGIVNGIDYNAYNPEKDKSLYKNFSHLDLGGKVENKLHLQQLFGLPISKNTPLISMTSRITFQKGFSLLLKILPDLMSLDLQLVIIGAGDKNYVNQLAKFARKYPKKIVLIPSHQANQQYETQVYAGSDFLLLPSIHEPCGINQLIAMRYGSIPIVREVGGLYDTVDDYNPITNRGNGFTFRRENTYELFAAIVRALENYRHRDSWLKLINKAMQQSNSWEIPAKKYIRLYRRAKRL